MEIVKENIQEEDILFFDKIQVENSILEFCEYMTENSMTTKRTNKNYLKKLAYWVTIITEDMIKHSYLVFDYYEKLMKELRKTYNRTQKRNGFDPNLKEKYDKVVRSIKQLVIDIIRNSEVRI